MVKQFRVALLANLKVNAPKFEGMPEDQWDDLDSERTINALIDSIRAGGHVCEFLEGDLSLFHTLPLFKPDICFNICEGHFGDSREAHIPALLEMMRIPYTGSRVMTLALSLDKPMTKRILTYHDLVETGDMIGPRIYHTGPGVFSRENVRSLEHAREVLTRYKDYYQLNTCKMYMSGNRQGNIQGKRKK